ncbi:hypothetical protein Enr13x_16230 [Stieleria neptunia]|uniref:DUF2271 domain-containing protein n=1 Tax=Stieleria neptunia TaxID=2527979 RepID=A0A518HLT0_9BACT|nr:DUF2271 domain-containing protein [Stieleria neptunia]QDV41780.1 hypothetical protein Enr13x_16230 [Stieleria neptunia]
MQLNRIAPLLLLALGGIAAAPAEDLQVSVEIPRLNVSEYHRPYVAVWIQDKDRTCVANLSVWYQMRSSAEGAGTKWLPDLRQWWRRSGRRLNMPVDGVSGATRPAGKHTLTFASDDPRLADLKPGRYSLVVEASREVGGRELVEIPFAWPAESSTTKRAEGSEELGEVTFTLKPSS